MKYFKHKTIVITATALMLGLGVAAVLIVPDKQPRTESTVATQTVPTKPAQQAAAQSPETTATASTKVVQPPTAAPQPAPTQPTVYFSADSSQFDGASQRLPQFSTTSPWTITTNSSCPGGQNVIFALRMGSSTMGPMTGTSGPYIAKNGQVNVAVPDPACTWSVQVISAS